MSGVSVVSHTQSQGGTRVGSISNGDWIAFTPYALANATAFTARVARSSTSGTTDDPGPGRIADRHPARHGQRPEHRQLRHVHQRDRQPHANRPAGTTTLYLVFTGSSTSTNLFYLDSFTFTTTG